MRKRIICLILGLIMLLGVCVGTLASCGGNNADSTMEDIQDDASQRAVTLSMYLLSETPVDDATEKEIERAVNKITENKYKTRLDLRFFTKDGYYYYTDKAYADKTKEVKLYMDAEGNVNSDKIGDMIMDTKGDLKSDKFPELTAVWVAGYYEQIDKAFADRAAAKANGTIVTDKQETEGADETENVNGQIKIKYPAIANYQVDIFYMGGEEVFKKYKDSGMLKKLDDEITGGSKVLNTNIPSQFLSNIKSMNGGTYAIPTSKTIGEYTYLLLNKKALDAAYRSAGNGVPDTSVYTSLTSENVKDFIDYTIQNSDAKSDYYGIYTNLSSSDILINNIKYWGVDSEGALSDAFSVIGGYYNDKDNYLDKNTYVKMENLFENQQFVSDIKTLKYYESQNYINYEKVKDKKFAVGYVTGGAELVEQYGDEYELVPVSTPRLSEEEVYSDLFGVCENTANVGRSMQIICLMNTDENFRNLILYGIQDKHYRLVDTMLDNEYGDNIMAVERTDVGKAYYNMDVNKTGNTFVAYPEFGEDYSLKAYGIKQNQTAKVDMALGFKIDNGGYKVNVAPEGDAKYNTSMMKVQALSEKILADYRACSYDDIDTFIANARREIADCEAVQHHLKCNLDVAHKADGSVEGNNEVRCDSLYCCYQAWLKEKKVIA